MDPVWATALSGVRAHPRHLVLGSLVAGLLAAAPAAGHRALLVGLALAIAAALARLTGRAGLGLAAALAILSGALVADARLRALDRTALSSQLGRPLDVRATLVEQPRRSSTGGHAALVRLNDGRGRGERVLVRLGRRDPWPVATTGAELALRGRLVALRARDAYQRRRGAHAVLIARAVRPTGRARGGPAGALDRARSRAERGVAADLPLPLAALARGMVLGEDEQLSEPVRDEFRRSGLAHLLAASGQNVMLLAALALPLLALLGLALRARLLVVLALIAAYVPLAGAGPSIQRAGLMGAAGIVAGLAGRPSSRWYALLLAAAVTLAINPRAAGDPGWQLSFAAVVAIVALAARVRDALVARRVPGALAESMALTFSATLGTAPLIAFHFGRVSLASLPANLLAAPAVAPIMWLGMIAAAIGELAPAVAAPVNALAGYPLAYMGWLAHASASLPGASVGLQLGSPLAVAGAYLALLVPLAVRRVRGPAVVLACGGLAFAVATGARAPPAPPRGLVVSFLDIGQGDATLIQHGGAAVLVDTGPPGGPLLARLRSTGVRRLDVLVVTHAQADHEGEAADVLDHYPVGLLLDGGADAATSEHRQIAAAATRSRVRALTPDAGQVLHAGPIEVDVVWPKREPAELHAGQNPNQRAIVARVRDGGFTLLLTADAESDVTGQLALTPVHALKVAHHGSADPGLPGLLSRLRPRIAVISVGRHNPYGHPTAQALGALRTVPQLYRTDRDGTVRLSVGAGRMTVATGA